jgi:glycosyltransferase involved in cell wall biosynthesis
MDETSTVIRRIGDTHGCQLTYVLITPARNEAAFIEQTINSVVSQTVRPVKWVIVSDGSTDGTDDIVKKYAAKHKWIELVQMPERRERHFAGKVHAFNAGYARVRDLNYSIIGNLDADITFEEDYISFLLSRFAENPRLGVGGTPFREGLNQYDYNFTSIEHVSGACQLFRRKCFEDIGGYKPQKVGGVDLVAGLTARMKGWQTRTFLEKTCIHHRKMGKGMHRGWMVYFKGGRGDYMLGGHPIWEIFHSTYQMKNKPFIIGGSLRLTGFYWAVVTRVEKSVPKDLVEFRRKEQMHRLRNFFREVFALMKENLKVIER